jgi:NADH dehydrogenase [ubiquinone] 1 alpha subcomplex assembly factor 7
MAREVERRIAERIRREGPITFAAFMVEALYGAGGFYERPPVGTGGHFVTSPHVHPIFSRLVGAALEELWRVLDEPSPLRVVEVGAGDGTMARELIEGFARAGIELEYAAVEAGRGAREALATVTPLVAARIRDLPPLEPGVVVANELLDNLPFRRLRRSSGGAVEIRIGLDGDRLVEVEAPCEAELIGAAGATEIDAAPNGEAIVPTGAFAFVDEIAAQMRRGYALLVDYGPPGRGPGDVHGYRDHELRWNVLDDPGSGDITAGVDLAAVAAHARARGLRAFEPVSQATALRRLGIEAWLGEELAGQGELLRANRGAEAVRTWEGRGRARVLIDPVGLGDLRWLLLATPGLPAPSWVGA